MPYLKKPKKKHSYQKHDKNKDIAKIYNSSQWQKLRAAYFAEHPLCEMCLAEGKITPTQEIHHIKPISSGNSNSEMRALAYDYNNLEALCTECHHKVHQEMRRKNKKK